MSNHESKDQAGKTVVSIFALPGWLIAVTSAVLGAAGLALVEWLAPDKSQWTFPARLVLLTGVGVALLYLVLGLFYLRLWLRSRTTTEFGILWDMRNNPICSNCRGPLTKGRSGSMFQCPTCKADYIVTERTGGYILWWDAIKEMDKMYPRRAKGRKSRVALPPENA